MLRYQASLPHLPVPPLSSTLAKYLETIRPHLTSAEYERSEAVVREFRASPRAADLQKRLEERVAGPGTVNWLWYEAGFMAYRDPLVVYVSYFFVHVAEPAIQDAPKRRLRSSRPCSHSGRSWKGASRRALLCFCFSVANMYSVVLSPSAMLEPEKVRRGTALHGFVQMVVSFTIFPLRHYGRCSRSRPDSTLADIPIFPRTLPANSILPHTITSFSFATTGSLRCGLRVQMALN